MDSGRLAYAWLTGEEYEPLKPENSVFLNFHHPKLFESVIHYEEALIRVTLLLQDGYSQKIAWATLKQVFIEHALDPQWVYEDLCTGEETPLVTRLTELLELPPLSLSYRVDSKRLHASLRLQSMAWQKYMQEKRERSRVRRNHRAQSRRRRKGLA